MNDSLIRQNVHAFLASRQIPYNKNLPLISQSISNIRKIQEIGNRINVLHILYTISQEGANSKSYFVVLAKELNYWEFLTIEEKNTLSKEALSAQDIINFSWKKEAIRALLYTTNLIPELNDTFHECVISDYYHLMPPEVEDNSFFESLHIRNLQEIYYALDLLYNIHWSIKRYPGIQSAINHSVIIERRYALEWVTNNEIDWDNIVLDT